MDGKVAFDLLSRAYRSCEMESPHESEAWQALKSVVEIANSIQQLKAEILPLLIRALDEGTVSIETNDIRGYVEEVVAKLSAV